MSKDEKIRKILETFDKIGEIWKNEGKEAVINFLDKSS